MRAHLRMYPADFTTAVQSGNEITQKSSTSAENGPARADFFFSWTRFENLVAKRRKCNERVIPNLVAIM